MTKSSVSTSVFLTITLAILITDRTRLDEYENSKNHLQVMLTCYQLQHRLKTDEVQGKLKDKKLVVSMF